MTQGPYDISNTRPLNDPEQNNGQNVENINIKFPI